MGTPMISNPLIPSNLDSFTKMRSRKKSSNYSPTSIIKVCYPLYMHYYNPNEMKAEAGKKVKIYEIK